MVKKSIRKSIALVAAGSLALTGLATAPASAAGLLVDGYVTLSPTSGAEYDVLTGNAKEFSLTANFANAAEDAGEYLKFLVTNTNEDIVVDDSESTQYVATSAIGSDNVVLANVGAVDRVTLSNVPNNFKIGDSITVAGFDASESDYTGGAADATSLNGAAVIETASANTLTYLKGNTGDITAFTSDAAITVTLNTPAYTSATDSFVFNTKSDSNNADKVLVLETGNITTSRTATVTAWIDTNDDGDIDASEYVSPTRTIRWLTAAEVSATSTIQTQTVGASSVVAHVATTPSLNGDQMSAADVTAKFTVQGSPTSFTASSSTWNTTSNVWVATLSRVLAVDSLTFASPTATLKFEADHGLTTGETITVASMAASGNNGTFVVTVVDADEVSYTNTTPAVAVGTNAAGTGTVLVVAGAYSATAYIGSTAISGAVSNSVATATSAVGSAAVATDGNNNVTITSGLDATVVVRPETLAVSSVLTFVDSDDVAVTAGRPVVLTATTITNATGVTINGSAVTAGDTVEATTDANGQVTVAVTTTSGVATDVVKVTGVAEGVSGANAFAQWTWTAVSNTLHDLNGAGTARSVATGGAYSFDFLVADQWSQAQTGDLRLKVVVSGNTVSETYPSITAGRATVTVTDAEIGTGNVTVVVTPQKKATNGTWGTSGAAAAVTYTLYPSAQSGSTVTAVSADVSVAITTTAFVTGDSRLSQTAVTGDASAGTDAIEITGVVTNSLTGVVKSGAAVTVSGASTLLFVDGTRAQYGSITTYADANGAYSVHVRSNTSQALSVVTVAAHGGSKTIKVSFEAASPLTGTSLVITAPDYVAPGSTFIATGTVTDKWGNPIVVAANADGGADLKVTYSGAGLAFGSLPEATDAAGQAKVIYLLGNNDSGTITVTFSYDANGDEDYIDAGDLVVSKTVTIGSAPVVSDTKVNVGSFKGYVALYAKGYKGKKMSAIVAGKWIVVASLATDFERVVRYTGAGYDIVTTIYIDGVSVQSFNVTTK